MFELADRILARLDSGHRVAVATAVSVQGTAPRSVGTSMALTDDGEVIGSISGGCVEGAVYEACLDVLAGAGPRLDGFGFDDEEAFAVGLTCGGRIEVLVMVLEPSEPGERGEPGEPGERGEPGVTGQLRRAHAGQPAALRLSLGPDAGSLEPPDSFGSRESLESPPESPARLPLGSVIPSSIDCSGIRIFTEIFEPPARFLVFGAVEFSVTLAAAASVLGYRVTVCDPRSAFLTRARFPAAEEVVVEWPPHYLARTPVDARTVICVLSHDDRFDADLIDLALRGPARYVGAMGSRITHERRMTALAARDTPGLDRLRSPIGLDVGARSPEETAISILAEVLATRTGSSGLPLAVTDGPIHRAADVPVAAPQPLSS